MHVQRLGDRSAERRLANPRRAEQAEDGAAQVLRDEQLVAALDHKGEAVDEGRVLGQALRVVAVEAALN